MNNLIKREDCVLRLPGFEVYYNGKFLFHLDHVQETTLLRRKIVESMYQKHDSCYAEYLESGYVLRDLEDMKDYKIFVDGNLNDMPTQFDYERENLSAIMKFIHRKDEE